jgi:hypothetical protein
VSTKKKAVDRLSRVAYKARHFLTVALLLTATPAQARDLVVRGAVLPSGSKLVGEGRYKSPNNYADTLKFYSRTYRDNPRKTIVNQPGIRAVHIVNDGKGDWEGLNIYELDGETRIFVVPR